MKKIINRPEDVVDGMCAGIALAHPGLALNRKYRFLRKKDLDRAKVSLLSGGGSGHEPAHAGFVGAGLLDGAVCGDVFASPSQIQIYQAIRETASDRGTLLIVKNYSGDMMNFTNAAHMAREDGIEVDFVKVDDDIAVRDSLYTVGRRGVAGTLFVHKIAGAAAARGGNLPQVKAAAEKAAANVRSIGFALRGPPPSRWGRTSWSTAWASTASPVSVGRASLRPGRWRSAWSNPSARSWSWAAEKAARRPCWSTASAPPP